MSQKLKGMIFGLTIIMLVMFFAPASIAAQDNNTQQNQSFITTVWHKVVDWTVQTWNKVVTWVEEQSSQIARALTFWRDGKEPNEPELSEPPDEPQVLGEEAAAPTPTTNLQSPISNKQPITNNQLPISETEATEPVVSPSSPLPIQEPILEQPTVETPTEPVPVVPITTPEIIIEPEKAEAEPVKQNNSYFIPILARDTLAPSSAITALNATSTSPSFTVAWTGTDTNITGNPIVSSYDIQYQVDSGVWTDWLLRTTLLSDLFTNAQDEKIYGFRSRARDQGDNLEAYPDSADTRTYANLSIPVTPIVTSHTNGGTVANTTADEDASSGSTVQVTLTGTAEASNIMTITLSETSTTATTSVSLLGTWSKQFTLAEGTNTFSIKSQESDGDYSNALAFTLNLEIVPTREVVINEIAWMGTNDSADEWIELYNASSTAINLAGWTVAATDGSPSFTISSGTIAVKSYFLMERFDDTAIFDITADFVYPGTATQNQMNNTGEELVLRDSTSKLIDKVGSSTASWFAGSNTTKATMERKDPSSDGTLAASWASNDGSLINGKASDNSTALTATPKSLNSVNTTIPRAVTDLQMQFIYTTTTSVRLYWTTPKTANLATTTPATYDIRYRTSGCPLTESNWSSSTAATGEPTPSATQGTVATSTVSGLSASTSYCFAIKTNNGSNDSAISNSYTGTTKSGSYTQLAGYPGSSSATLASSTSPYYVTANLAIPNNMTLTIQPGTVVKLATGVNITFGSSSTLIMGTSSDTVNAAVITSRDDNIYNGPAKNGSGTIVSDGVPGAGDWGKILGGTGAVVTINHGIISYGGSSTPMLSFNAGTVTVSNSIIQYSNNHGLIIGGTSTSLSITNSIVRNTLDVGIGVTASSTATITGNTITGNRRGISVDTPADEDHITISQNNLYANNATTGDSTKPISGLHYADFQQLTAQNNWWGRASGPTTISPDNDPVTDAAMATGVGGSIDYSNPAASAFTILPNNL